ncbi:prepilin-type N-terminal cleavage/methylation domain-containing protein [Chitinimonas sp.]|uniref:prepilin-type N-terminal cleavage/methylation domain-containing protein n=1 Tax=Chitinimonas sp. TaxID=1934313 RepID=UPI002F925DAE
MRRHGIARISKGFTLIEIMVALAITALVMTLLMGASYYILQVRVKLVNEVSEGELHARRQLWLHEIASSMQPLEREAPDGFEGKPEGFHGLAVRSLRGESNGAPELVNLLLKRNESGEMALHYQAGDADIVLASWPDANAAFSYQNRAGKLLDSWTSAEQATERLPRAVALKVGRRSDDSALDYYWIRLDAEPWIKQQSPAPFTAPGS